MEIEFLIVSSSVGLVLVTLLYLVHPCDIPEPRDPAQRWTRDQVERMLVKGRSAISSCLAPKVTLDSAKLLLVETQDRRASTFGSQARKP